jgi:hypothetical protein
MQRRSFCFFALKASNFSNREECGFDTRRVSPQDGKMIRTALLPVLWMDAHNEKVLSA